MSVPSIGLTCLVCGQQVTVNANTATEGVISFPTYHCAICPGNPQMVSKILPQATTDQGH